MFLHGSFLNIRLISGIQVAKQYISQIVLVGLLNVQRKSNIHFFPFKSQFFRPYNSINSIFISRKKRCLDFKVIKLISTNLKFDIMKSFHTSPKQGNFCYKCFSVTVEGPSAKGILKRPAQFWYFIGTRQKLIFITASLLKMWKPPHLRHVCGHQYFPLHHVLPVKAPSFFLVKFRETGTLIHFFLPWLNIPSACQDLKKQKKLK